jgi:hypothetical protein
LEELKMVKAIWSDYSGMRLEVVEREFADVRDALNWLGSMPRVSGPNGPCTSKSVVVDGIKLRSLWDAASAAGLTPKVRYVQDVEVFAGVE